MTIAQSQYKQREEHYHCYDYLLLVLSQKMYLFFLLVSFNKMLMMIIFIVTMTVYYNNITSHLQLVKSCEFVLFFFEFTLSNKNFPIVKQ